MIVYLVPARARFELYSEAPEDPTDQPASDDGWFRRWMHKAVVQWRQMVDSARNGSGAGRFARWRDRLVRHLAESIAEQRTLWALRQASGATARFPATIASADARAALDRLLAHARRHHRRWLIIDLVATAITGPLFFFVPGPNVISLYFTFRFLGHFLSWRGARQAMDRTSWTLEPDAGLAELAGLVDVPRATRAPRVAAIAAQLNLPRLSAFFDRVTV
jgi:hypothetical protein